jgi:hypothetical protein
MPKAVNVAVERRRLGEELGVGRVGAGIAALDVVEPELVEQPAITRLSSSEKSTPGVCCAVPQRRVIEIEAFAGGSDPAIVPETPSCQS